MSNLEIPTNLKNVSNDLIYRGEYTLTINNATYKASDYDTAVKGLANELLQSETNDLYIHNQDDTYIKISPIKAIDDVNVTKYKFKPKGAISMISEKVVGTTFKFKEFGERNYTEFLGVDSNGTGTPVRTGKAILLPEPTNPYDANAIAVIAAMQNGKSFPLGYLARGSQLYNSIKSPTLAQLIITAYSEGGDFNDSYVVEI